MKKIIFILAIVFSIISIGSVFGFNLCTQPIGWKMPGHWHFNAVLDCHHVRCTLVDRSGGIPDPDPNKNTFWENIDWTFSKNEIPIVSNQCQAYPMNSDCDFNMPRHTCAALYVMNHVID